MTLAALLKETCPHCAVKAFLRVWMDNNPDQDDSPTRRAGMFTNCMTDALAELPKDEGDTLLMVMPAVGAIVLDLERKRMAADDAKKCVDDIFTKSKG